MTALQNSEKYRGARTTAAHSNLGLGVGLRHVHFAEILATRPQVDWFEIVSENFMDDYGWSRHVLREIAQQYPVAMHGVSLSVGSTDPLDIGYLKRLDRLAREVDAKWISDHLCWTGIHDTHSHDLLPLPLTEESLRHVAQRVARVQDILERRIILENPSTYLVFKQSTIEEWAFLNALCDETDCGILLDVNNVYVSARNHGFDPVHYIDQLAHERVVQIHIAGHSDLGDHCIDTHDQCVADPVWSLYAQAQRLTGGVSTSLEWDASIPPLTDVLAELSKAKSAVERSLGASPCAVDPAAGRRDLASNPIEFLIGAQR